MKNIRQIGLSDLLREVFLKRILVILLIPVLLFFLPSGCRPFEADGRINVVCTIFPQYDWLCRILGDNHDRINPVLLVKNGTDMHSYQPAAADIARISSCDMLIYTGGESESWVKEVLRDKVNKNMIVIDLLEELGSRVKEERGSDTETQTIDGAVPDEHIWLSLDNAVILCRVIEEQLSLLDPENAEIYADHLTAYTMKLSELDGEYRRAVDEAYLHTLVFADRFPFIYLTGEYNLDYYAAFPGCSAETEASFETVVLLAGKIDELNLKVVLVTESSDEKLAQTIVKNTVKKNQQILRLDSMQSISLGDIAQGISYLQIMENNLKVLKAALS